MLRPSTRLPAAALALTLLATAPALAREGATTTNGTTRPAAVGVTTPIKGSRTSTSTTPATVGTPLKARGATTGTVAAPLTGTRSAATTTPAPATPAGGAAAPSTTTATTTPLVPTRTSAAPAAAPTQSKRKGGGRHISTGAAIIAALAALLALGAAGWALARYFAYEPAWSLGARHAIAEASLRTSSTWAEVKDWARIGR